MSVTKRFFKILVGGVIVFCFAVGANAQGADLRGDIELRREWVARLTETEQRFHNMISSAPPPYTLFYSNNISTGNVNYQTETADVSVSLMLAADREWFSELERSLQEAQQTLSELNATGRKSDWQLGRWPQEGLTRTNPFRGEYDTVTVETSDVGFVNRTTHKLPSPWRYEIVADFELVDARGRVLGRQAIRFNPYFRIFESERNPITNSEENTFKITLGYTQRTNTNDPMNRLVNRNNRNRDPGYLVESNITFSGIKVDDINENLTVRVASLNGQPPQNSQFRTRAVTEQERQSMIEAERGAVQAQNLAARCADWERMGRRGIRPNGCEELIEQRTGTFRIENGVVLGFADGINVSRHRDLVIPSEIQGQRVTAIGDGAFKEAGARAVIGIGGGSGSGNVRTRGDAGKGQLTSVIIPDGVTRIGNEAFASNRLTSVTIPNSVTTIGNGAFAINHLDNIDIPNSVTVIGNGAFADNQLTSVVIPVGVTVIANNAFANNRLVNVTIHENVTSIGDSAFIGSGHIRSNGSYVASTTNQLTAVNIPNSVRTIGERAFAGNRISEITIGADVTIAERAFGIHPFFANFYNNNRTRRQAGTYEFSESRGAWRLKRN